MSSRHNVTDGNDGGAPQDCAVPIADRPADGGAETAGSIAVL